jgi:N,N'-diacetyllegionaminate synthase
MSETLDIAGRRVGPGEPVFVIAEIGINHNGDHEVARRMIDVAAEAGADAVKFQTYTTEDLVAKGNPYYEIFKNAELSDLAQLIALQSYAEARNILFFSSAASETGFAILKELDVPLYKLSSANLTNTPLFEKVAKTGKPVIFSSGAATLSEVIQGTEILREHGAGGVALLKCTSIYPCPPEHVNLRGLGTLIAAHDGPVGYSDHSVGSVAATAAVALGACIVEKHFTLDKTMAGHDHHYSADPAELSEMVQAIRSVEAMMGSARIEPVGEEFEFRAIGRRSVTALTDISEGQRLDTGVITLRRPKDGPGVSPEHMEIVQGRKARRSIPAGHSIKWDDI